MFIVYRQCIADTRSILSTFHILIFWRVIIGTQHQWLSRSKTTRSADMEQERGRSNRNSLSSSHHTYTILFVPTESFPLSYRIPYQSSPPLPRAPPLYRIRNASPPSLARHPTTPKLVPLNRKKSPLKASKRTVLVGKMQSSTEQMPSPQWILFRRTGM